MKINRRELIAGMASAGLLSRPGLVAAQDNTLVVTSLGGRWEQSIRRDFIPIFTKKTGIEVVVVSGGVNQWTAQIESQPNNPPLNAIDNSNVLALQLMDKGLVLPMTFDLVPNLRDVPSRFYDPWNLYGVSYQYGASGIFYDKTAIQQPPRTWPEFMERAARGEFGRNVALPDISYASTTELVWHLASTMGGSLDNLDPAFDALKQVKPYVKKFWSTAIEAERLALTREVEIGWLWDGRVYAMMDAGAGFLDFTRLGPTSLLSLVPAQVVKTEKSALAYEWVNTLLDPIPLLEYYKTIQYTPTNSKVHLPAEMADRIMPVQDGALPDIRELTKATPTIIARWNEEMRS